MSSRVLVATMTMHLTELQNNAQHILFLLAVAFNDLVTLTRGISTSNTACTDTREETNVAQPLEVISVR